MVIKISYSKQTWSEYNDSQTADENLANGAIISADRLNHMETGISNSDINKVNVSDMRKPASDVAGIEEVSTLQTQVDNSAVGTNLLVGTGNSSSVTGTNISNQVMYTYLLANRYNVSSLTSALGTQFTISYDWSVSGSSPSGTFNLVWDAFPWGHGMDALNTVSSSNTSGHFSSTFNLSTDIKSVANRINVRLDNFVGTLKVSNMKLEKGSVATDWCPNPEDKVTDNHDGTIEVNGSSITPADDSKVAHLSGANNFDTVPTYGTNNKPFAINDTGATTARPTGQAVGYQYFDTTLNKPIWYNGANWVDSTGTTV